jgi:hypothetical protein
MNLLRKFTFPTVGFAVMVLLLTLAAPRAPAVIAQLVQLVKTTADPAITQDTSKRVSEIVTLHGASICVHVPHDGGSLGYITKVTKQ